MYTEFAEMNLETGTYRKNEAAWSLLFDNFPVMQTIEENGLYEVNAKIFNEKCKREARLMAKVESRETMPSLLRKNQLCILPCKSRGNYVIGHFDAFQDLSYDNLDEVPVSTERSFDTLNPYDLSKEPSLILTAQNYGILSSLADDQDLVMTNFGRGYAWTDKAYRGMESNFPKTIGSHNAKASGARKPFGIKWSQPRTNGRRFRK